MLAEYRLTSRGAVSRRRSRWLLQGLAPSVVLGSCLWIESPRFGLRVPSLVDDWFGITYSGRAIHALLHAHYSAADVDFAGRYRPAYTALWNYTQWHLLGPASMSIAGLWEIGRIMAFVVSLALVSAYVAGAKAPLSRPIVWLAPFAVVMTPQFAVDLARYGPADPVMLAGIVIGLTLVSLGLRTMARRETTRSRSALCVSVVFLGYLVYLVGVYSKETSVCLLVFIPFFLVWLGHRLPRGARRELLTRPFVCISGILLIAPLIHVGFELLLSRFAGRTPYTEAINGSHSDSALAIISPFVGAPGILGTLLWTLGVPIALAVAVALVRQRHPDAWLIVGILVTGWLMTTFQLADGQAPSRYYLPWIVAVAAVLVRGLSDSDRRVQVVVAAAVIAIAPLGAKHAVSGWIQTEKSGATAVDLAAGVVHANCSLYLANFDVERRVAIPRLLGFATRASVPRCGHDSRAGYALTWAGIPLPVGFTHRCRSGWRDLAMFDDVRLYQCRSVDGHGLPDQDAASGNPRTKVVRFRFPVRAPSPSSLFRATARGRRTS